MIKGRVLLIVAIVGGLLLMSQKSGYAALLETRGAEYKPHFEKWEKIFSMPQGLLSRVAYQESRFDPAAHNVGSNAQGMMQIVPRWHPEAKPYDPIHSIEYAARYLVRLHGRFGSWHKALAAYNWGQGNLSKYGMDNLPKETRNYVAEITRDIYLTRDFA